MSMFTLACIRSNVMQRIEFLDDVKALATVMVVFLHSYSVLCYQQLSITTFDWSVAVFYDSMVRPAVPLFLMASGAVMLAKDYSLKTFFIDKVLLRLFVPYCFYAYFYWNANASLSNPMSICYHFAFVGIIITIYLLYPLFRQCVVAMEQSPSLLVYFICLWFLCVLLSNFFPQVTIFSNNPYFLYMGYPVAGYFLRKNTITATFPVKNLFVAYVCVVVFTYAMTIYLSLKKQVFDETYFSYLHFNVVVMSILAFVMLKHFQVFSVLNSQSAHRMKMFLSQHSYGIFFIHPLFLEQLYGLHGSLNTLVSGVAICFSALCASAVCIYIPGVAPI
ncbi:acyltransferase family protein [Desulfovibrio sp. XJ01]|nr:acyltransferase family protein [Nitratidesulfovibrio liaohensis]